MRRCCTETTRKAALVLSLFFVGVDAHGSMIMPPARNSIDAEMNAWAGGKHPDTGHLQPYSCKCTNGTDTCNNGQSCFWFSNGCTPGCQKCSGNGNRYPNFDHCPNEKKDLKPSDMLLKNYTSEDPTFEWGTSYDIFKYNPWRAPGKAPVFDACGMAGGQQREGANAAAYDTTEVTRMGDLGSKVLKPRPSGTVWRKGGIAHTRWQLTANHGGGYQYRLCPVGEELTEACFQKMPLAFATETHMLRFANASEDHEIKAMDVKEGGGVGWRLIPMPNVRHEPCDVNMTALGKHCQFSCPGCGPPEYAFDESCPSVCAEYYPNTPDYRHKEPVSPFPNPVAGKGQTSFAVEDTLTVPADIPAGEYVLGWRWDCEQTSQIWNSCADISIADSEEFAAENSLPAGGRRFQLV